MEHQHAPGPAIPLRVSSKRKELESRLTDIDEDIKITSEKLKLKVSFDAPFWLVQGAIQDQRIKHNQVKKRLSMLDFELDEGDEEAVKKWQETTDGQQLMEKEAALVLSQKLLLEHARSLEENKDENTSARRAFMQLIFGSKLGFNLNNQLGRRLGRLQTMFRKELEEVYDAKYPDSSYKLFWCPVQTRWVPKVVAAHLFPAKSGNEIMETIFGPPTLDIDPEHPKLGKGELFRAVNGILWSEEAEERFEKGQFVIVPDVNDTASTEDVRAWRQSNPREYKMRVVKPEAPDMQLKLSLGDPTRWRDLDNKTLVFQSTFRPRTRYLYFAYCQIVLRNAYVPEASSSIMPAEVGKKHWGTTGRFMRKSMLMGFVEQLGHDYDYLLENAFGDESPTEPDVSALLAANQDNQEKMMTEEERYDIEVEEEEEEEQQLKEQIEEEERHSGIETRRLDTYSSRDQRSIAVKILQNTSVIQQYHFSQ